MDNNGLTR